MGKQSTTRVNKAAQTFTRLLVVEDHPLVRKGIVDAISGERDLKICGEATSVAEAHSLLASETPDLVLADLSLREGTGIELIRQIRESGSRVPILVLSMREETTFAERVIREGAQGYVSKCDPSERLISAIRQILRGELALSEEVKERLVRRAAGLRTASPGSPGSPGSPASQGRSPSLSVLSDRELEIFEMFGRGRTASEIARQLGISAKTVQAHRENIKAKLELRTSTALTRYAALWADGDRAAIERAAVPSAPPAVMPRGPGPRGRVIT